MRQRRKVGIGAGLAIAASLGWGGASPAAPPVPGGPPRAGGIAEAPPTADEMREAMQELMLVRMKRALRLTPDQERRVVPRMRALFDARRDFAVRRRAALMRLRALVLDDAADEAEIRKGLARLREIDAQFRERQEGMRDAIDAELRPRQQARLLFFEERFRRAMQRRLQQGGPPGAERRRGAGPGGEGPPTDPLDDDAGDESGP